MAFPSSSSSSDDLLRALDAFRAKAAARASEYLTLAQEIDSARDNVMWSASTGVASFPTVYVGEIFRVTGSLSRSSPEVTDARNVVQFISSGSTATATALSLSTGSLPTLVPPTPRQTQTATLDQLLRELWGSDDLVVRRTDAWRTLQLSTPNACAQACHSHREIVTAMLDKCAPPEVVEKAPWWSPPTETGGKVSKRQKLKYFIVRTDPSGLSDAVLADLDSQVTIAMDAHQAALSLAHGKVGASFNAAKAAMIDLESVLLTALTYRRSNAAHPFPAT